MFMYSKLHQVYIFGASSSSAWTAFLGKSMVGSEMHFEFRLVLVVVCHVDSHRYLTAGSCVDKPGYLLNAEANRDMVLQSAMVASCLGRTAILHHVVSLL